MENEKENGWTKVSGESEPGTDSSVQQNVSASEPEGYDYSFAPHGRDANGVPLAPYRWTKDRATKKFRVKKAEGRSSDNPNASNSERIGEDDSKALLNDLQPQPGQQQAGQQQQQQGAPNTAGQSSQPQPQKFEVNISGAMFLFALDTVVPGAMALAYNFLSTKNTVDHKALKMDAQEMEQLTPSADAVVKELLSGLSPLQQFMLFTFIMYGSKLMYAEKTPKLKKQAQPVDTIGGKKEDEKKKKPGK